MQTRTRTLTCLTAIALLGLLVASGGAAAQQDNNRGTVKIHDDLVTDPEQRNVPHVSCDFYVEGFNFKDGSGFLKFFSWPPTGNKTEVTPTGDTLNWTGTPDGDGEFDFLKGAYVLPEGHYRLEVYTLDDHPGHDEGHFAKAKTFWVDECENNGREVPCPPDVSVEAAIVEGSPVVTLSWGAVEGADAYVVYRAVDGGDFEAIETTTDLQFVDEDVEAGVTYEYYVTAVIGNAESENCAIVSVTPIPFFPGATSLVLGSLGALGAIAIALRRRS